MRLAYIISRPRIVKNNEKIPYFAVMAYLCSVINLSEMHFKPTYLRLIPVIVVALLAAACASMGRPEGGPRDDTPPVYVRSNPAPGAVNVSRDRIVIEFDENVEIKDAMNKVVVSPTQKTMPKISAVGRRVTVNIIDTLIPDATYTLDFTDAIVDLNEGNILDGFAFDFATGPVLDSLCISGMVFRAENLEPAQGMLVGVHSNLADSAIRTLPFDRITRTNQLGQFTIRNLKEGTYNVFAINDVNRDNKWDRSEDIAFLGHAVSPSAARVSRTDTIRTEAGLDSTFVHEVTEFLPADLLLTWFNENYKAHYLAKYERRDRNKIYFEMGAPSDSLPRMTILGGPYDGRDFSKLSVLNGTRGLDTLEYWITDTALIALDSITIATTYLRTDSLEQIVWNTDTLQFNMRPKKDKDKKKETTRVINENPDSASAPPPLPLLKIKSLLPSTAEVYSGIAIETDQPIASFADSAVRLEIMVDSTWTAVTPPRLQITDSLRPMRLEASYTWEPGGKYRLSVDTLAVTGIYGLWNGNWNYEFTVRKLEEYANLTIDISAIPAGAKAMAQLVNTSDKPVYTVPVENSKAIFRHLTPGTYYARLFIDSNGNGKWDTGNLADSLQPEDVYYMPRKIDLKKNWDVQLAWNLDETPVDLQKPAAIKKNKPKNGPRDNQDPEEEDDQYYDEFGNPAVDPDDPFGKRKGQRYNNLNSRDNMYNGQNAGYRSSGRMR